jgi:hypothetical protein
MVSGVGGRGKAGATSVLAVDFPAMGDPYNQYREPLLKASYTIL